MQAQSQYTLDGDVEPVPVLERGDGRHVRRRQREGGRRGEVVPSPGRHCHSTLSWAVIGCHALGIYSNLAVIAVTFCQNDSVSVAPG